MNGNVKRYKRLFKIKKRKNKINYLDIKLIQTDQLIFLILLFKIKITWIL